MICDSFIIRVTNTIQHDVVCNTVDAFQAFDGLLARLLEDFLRNIASKSSTTYVTSIRGRECGEKTVAYI